MKVIILPLLGLMLTSHPALAGERPMLPNVLRWVCPVPDIWGGQDKAKKQLCSKEEAAFNREENYGHGEADELNDKFALKFARWRTLHHEEKDSDSWKKSPELTRLHQKFMAAYHRYMKAQTALMKCHKEALKKLSFSLNVYSEPTLKSKKLGTIVIDGNFHFWFVDGNGKRRSFNIDSYDQDGTACQTLLAQKGDWFEIPGPFSEPAGWINVFHDWHVKEVPRPIKDLIVKGFPDEYASGFLIKDIKNGFIIGRKEMPYDMDCGAPDGRAETPAEEKARRAKEKAAAEKVPVIRIPVQKAYDDDGHIIFTEKYTRGC